MKFVIFWIILIACNVCLAGTEIGTVRFTHGQYSSGSSTSGMTFFYLEGGSKSGSPSCASYDNGERWVINNNWPAAKFQYSTLLTAFVSGLKVQVTGTGACEVYGVDETANDIRLVH